MPKLKFIVIVSTAILFASFVVQAEMPSAEKLMKSLENQVYQGDCVDGNVYCSALTEPGNYEELLNGSDSYVGERFSWDEFLQLNNLPKHTKKSDPAPILSFHAVARK